MENKTFAKKITRSLLWLPLLIIANNLLGAVPEDNRVKKFLQRQELVKHLPPLNTFLNHDLQEYAFKESVTKQRTHSPELPVKKLNAIVPWNKELVWNPEKTHILMTTFMDKSAFDRWWAGIKKGDKKTVSFEGWVAPVPELKEFAKEFYSAVIAKPEAKQFTESQLEDIVTQRIQQYLGLPPLKATPQKKVFVEVWVKPQDLLRPCIDTEIVDTGCLYDLPTDRLPDSYKEIWNYVRETTPEYKKWFENRKQGFIKTLNSGNQETVPSVYDPHGWTAMPWTRLGFAFDWGKPSEKHFGASEYVIRNKSVFGAPADPDIIFDGAHGVYEYITGKQIKSETPTTTTTTPPQEHWEGL